jgi:uncharacterized protein
VSPDAVICIFAKPPRPGEVKTRLARSVGPQRAADLARAFLIDTWSAAQAQQGARAILATSGPLEQTVTLDPQPEIWAQGEGDLGQRMERVLRRGLSRYPVAVALGTDSPGLPPRLIQQALHLLAQGADAVFGPAEDGGFYLMGLRRCPEGLLAGLPWSRDDTYALTRARLEAQGLSVAEVERWFDVDHPEDLARLRRLIEAQEIDAPATAAALLAADA